MSRPARLLLACLAATLLAGGLGTGWVVLGLEQRPDESLPLAVAGVGVAALGVAALFVRFVRWQFALRRLGVRLRTVESLAAFVGSFAFLPVPLLVGQLVARRRLLPEASRPGPGPILGAFVWERLLDAWALLVLSLLAVADARWLVAGLAVALLPVVPRLRIGAFLGILHGLARFWAVFSPRALDLDRERLRAIASGRVLAAAAAASLLAWALVGAGLALVGAAAGAPQQALALAGLGAASVLVGGLSGMPLGVAVSGFFLLDRLDALGMTADRAVGVVFVYRVTTAWLAVTLGAVAAGASLWRRRRRARSSDHFDSIDPCYDSWLPPHYREHVVRKKVEAMAGHLASLEGKPRGLDIGCGRGWYLAGMRAAGTQTVGIDLSRRQLAAACDHAGERGALAQGSALHLPFRDGAFDFAYTVNVVHHLESRDLQYDAFSEVARVLRPGGLFFLHEMNTRNPIFRAYLGYVFPIIKGIDEGIERFLHPERLTLPPSLEPIAVEYFTFLPDFCPRSLLPTLARVEERLERSRLAPLSAHFVVVLRRTE